MPSDYQRQAEEEYAAFAYANDGIGINGSHRGDGSKPVPSRVVGARAALPDADRLLAKRAEIVRHLAPLRALYGGNGYGGERQLKIRESAIDLEVRATFAASNEKATEGKIDATVRNDPRYIEALTADVQARTRWIELEEALAEVDWRLRVRQADSNLMAAEARLG